MDLMQGAIAVENVHSEVTVVSAKDCKVLVVDDNMVNRRVARLRLQAYGLEVEEADSGKAAIELVRGKRYDIIFMDHLMPEMDGIEAAQIIRKDCGENGRLPIMIALTANATEDVRESFLANGFQDFIAKPLETEPLRETLHRWIRGEMAPADSRPVEFQDILIAGIDMDEALAHGSDNIEEYRELLQLYYLDGKRKPALLRAFWEKGDHKGYGIEVHGLKSASAGIGAMKISESAKEHEMAVYRGDEAFVDSHISQLLADYEEQVEHIRIFLEKGRTCMDVQEKKQEMGRADLLREIRDALDSLEHFRAKECARKIEDILQYRLDPDTERKLGKIQEQLKLYEDDAAEQMLRDLTKQIETEG